MRQHHRRLPVKRIGPAAYAGAAVCRGAHHAVFSKPVSYPVHRIVKSQHFFRIIKKIDLIMPAHQGRNILSR
jgi:hypothetical protein